MNKHIIITGGPTNEPIDEVMKITNMSTGRFPAALGAQFAHMGFDVSMILNHSVDISALDEYISTGSVKIVRVETTLEMLDALKNLKGDRCSALIHAAAVGDYAADFSFLMEDLAEEIYKDMRDGKIESPEDILRLMEDGSRYMIDSSSKISSYQKNLTVKLCLTPKIISHLRKWYPDALIIGCKLLENVPKDELFDVAMRLCGKNEVDFVMANDLADLRAGNSERYLVSPGGYTGKVLHDVSDVCNFVAEHVR